MRKTRRGGTVPLFSPTSFMDKEDLREKMSKRRMKMCKIQSLRMSVNEQLTLAGEEIFGVFEKRTNMSKIHIVRLFVNERLTAAAEEILGLFVRAAADYQQEIDRQRKILDIILNPVIRLHRADSTPSSECVTGDHDERQTPPPYEDQSQRAADPDGNCFSSGCSGAESEDGDWKGSEGVQGDSETPEPDGTEKGRGSGVRKRSRKSDRPASHRCSLCGETFQHVNGLVKHAESHSDNPKCVCVVCWEHLDSAEALTQHLKSHREPYGTGGTCDICGKSFQNMETHMRRHTGFKPYSCGVCAKRFPRPGALRRHKKIHLRVEPYVCQRCGLKFVENEALQAHMKTHEEEADEEEAGEEEAEDGDAEAGGETPSEPKVRKSKREKGRGSGTGPVKTTSYCCKVCGDSFFSKGFLRKHAETHAGDAECVCGVCGERSESTESFADHLLSHKETGGTCGICGKSFQNMETHTRSHTGFKPYSCGLCGKRFPRAGALRRHKKLHTGERPYVCKYCDKGFIESSALKIHVKSHSVLIQDSDGDEGTESGGPPSDSKAPELERGSRRTGIGETPSKSSQAPPPHRCKVCGESFEKKGYLRKHAETHSRDPQCVCGVCGEHVDSTGALMGHLQGHREAGKICYVCGKTFQNIETHMRRHTGLKPYSCGVCSKQFPRPGALRRHKKIHTGERPCICEFCGKTFIDGSALTTHIKNHTGQKPDSRVACDVCGKSLASVQVLLVHKRIHTGEKPFACRVCGKSFRQMAGLNAHMLTHTGEKPFSCTMCSKSFSTKGYLETHLRFHKKDKPFSCHLCWKAFVTKTDLKKHLLTHTGEKPYSCRVCGKSYQEKRSRDMHMKVHVTVKLGKDPMSISNLRRHESFQGDFIQL